MMNAASVMHKRISAPTEWHQRDASVNYSIGIPGPVGSWYGRHIGSYPGGYTPRLRRWQSIGLVRKSSWEDEEEKHPPEDSYSVVSLPISGGSSRRQSTAIRSIRPSDAVDYISAGVFDLIQSTIRRVPERDSEFRVKLRELLREHLLEYDRQVVVSELISSDALLTPSELADMLIADSAGYDANVLESMRANSELIGLPFAGETRYPSFQFDVGRSHVHSVVAKINIELDASDDPWGVTAWWYSENARLGTRPVDLLDVVEPTLVGANDEGLDASHRLLSAAKAVTEPVG